MHGAFQERSDIYVIFSPKGWEVMYHFATSVLWSNQMWNKHNPESAAFTWD